MPCVPCEGVILALSPTKKQRAGVWGWSQCVYTSVGEAKLCAALSLPVAICWHAPSEERSDEHPGHRKQEGRAVTAKPYAININLKTNL